MSELSHPDRNGQSPEPCPVNQPSTPLGSDSNHDNNVFASNNVRLMMIPVERIKASSLQQLRQDFERVGSRGRRPVFAKRAN